MSPIALALLTVLAAFVVGGALIAVDIVFIGIIVALAGVPVGFVVWMTRE